MTDVEAAAPVVGNDVLLGLVVGGADLGGLIVEVVDLVDALTDAATVNQRQDTNGTLQPEAPVPHRDSQT